MFMFRFLSVLIPSLLILSPVKGEDVEYTWRGTAGNTWETLSNWSVGVSTPSVAPGAQSSAYTHWMTTNGADSVGRTDVGAWVPEEGILRVSGWRVSITSPEGKFSCSSRIQTKRFTFVLRMAESPYQTQSTGGYNADFGIAQLRVASDQTWHVDEGRSFYVGSDETAPAGGLYSLTSENDDARLVTLTGAGAVRIGEGMLLNNISGMIGFVMSAGQGTPTLDLADRGMANTITVQDTGCLEGMALYQGSLITRENSSVTFSGTTAKVSSLWNIGKNTAIALESSTLDMSEAGVEAEATLSGTAGISVPRAR